MLQSYVAWYQLTFFISPYQLCCCLLEIGWPRPLPTGPAHSTGEIGVFLYPESILLLLRYLIWSSFQYLIILVTCFSTHACLAWNQLSSSCPTSYIAVGWRLDDAHLFPGPTHSTGGRGDDGFWPWPWQGGWGGDPEPGTYIYVCLYVSVHREVKLVTNVITETVPG